MANINVVRVWHPFAALRSVAGRDIVTKRKNLKNLNKVAALRLKKLDEIRELLSISVTLTTGRTFQL